ncbi:MAG: hypothetical protein WAO57_00540 [Syntrophomonadaceae bacterium]
MELVQPIITGDFSLSNSRMCPRILPDQYKKYVLECFLTEKEKTSGTAEVPTTTTQTGSRHGQLQLQLT